MRYLFGILATFGLIILILFLLLRGGGSTPETKALKLDDYATSNSSAHYVLDGPIVADEKHQEIKIDVDANQVTLSLYKGYEGDLVKQSTYANNQTAYTIFLHALQNVGYTKGNADKSLQDERGVCPLSQRRIYSFENDSKQLMRFWATGCGTKTFDGEVDDVSSLFRKQVPDYDLQIATAKYQIF